MENHNRLYHRIGKIGTITLLVLAVVLFAFPEGVADLAITILALIIIIAGIVTAIVAYLMRNKVVVTTYEKIEE